MKKIQYAATSKTIFSSDQWDINLGQIQYPIKKNKTNLKPY